MWSRSTILWKLECEESKPRAGVFQSMVTARENKNGAKIYNIVIMVLAGIFLLLGPSIAGCIVNIDHEKWG